MVSWMLRYSRRNHQCCTSVRHYVLVGVTVPIALLKREFNTLYKSSKLKRKVSRIDKSKDSQRTYCSTLFRH